MKYLLLICSIFLVGCSIVREAPADVADQLKAATYAKVEAEHKADAAIHTSADARKAESQAREEARAALALAAEKTGEADRLGKEAVRLRNSEVAEKITLYSWILIGVGLITGAVGAFIGVRFQSKTGLVVALCGGIVSGVGLVGLLVAPHWLLVAWVFVGVLIVGVIGLLVWLLLRHEAAAKVMASQWIKYSSALTNEARANLDSLSQSEQPDHLRDLITAMINKSKSESLAKAK